MTTRHLFWIITPSFLLVHCWATRISHVYRNGCTCNDVYLPSEEKSDQKSEKPCQIHLEDPSRISGVTLQGFLCLPWIWLIKPLALVTADCMQMCLHSGERGPHSSAQTDTIRPLLCFLNRDKQGSGGRTRTKAEGFYRQDGALSQQISSTCFEIKMVNVILVPAHSVSSGTKARREKASLCPGR